MSLDSPKLLSFNGRFIWSIHKNEETNLNCFLCYKDLLTDKSLNYSIIGHYSPIVEPVTIYWLTDGNEEEIVLIDMKLEGTQKILSQRIFKINHSIHKVVWVGPEYRQFTTGISYFSNVLIGEKSVVLIGICHSSDFSMDGVQHMLTLPRIPTSDVRSNELVLPDIVNNLKGAASGSFFFLAKPKISGLLPDNNFDRLSKMEPRNQMQKLFFLGELRDVHYYNCGEVSSKSSSYEGYFTCENKSSPLYGAFPHMPSQSLRLRPFAELQNTSNFPPQPKDDGYYCSPSLFEFFSEKRNNNRQALKINFKNTQKNSQLIPALFWTKNDEDSNIRRWHLGYLNLLEKQWSSTIAEWDSTTSEKAQVLMSANGNLLALICTNENEKDKIRCFRMSNQYVVKPPTLLDITIVSIQCSDNLTLKTLAKQLMTSFGK
ncbi:SUI1 domain-containing protein [Meloidogyne graminicola]|uniref:SUI1 domain-containing protein n=1 Tax=Meloidogyne graminicola TaxID=189291 RepID=A0A8T0A2A1_9BILA|nr:SUI1 domain-containing protein [Meloidogyne graminicola]